VAAHGGNFSWVTLFLVHQPDKRYDRGEGKDGFLKKKRAFLLAGKSRGETLDPSRLREVTIGRGKRCHLRYAKKTLCVRAKQKQIRLWSEGKRV